jgi:NO-binding membrane sensor protein with MHYT domain
VLLLFVVLGSIFHVAVGLAAILYPWQPFCICGIHFVSMVAILFPVGHNVAKETNSLCSNSQNIYPIPNIEKLT